MAPSCGYETRVRTRSFRHLPTTNTTIIIKLLSGRVDPVRGLRLDFHLFMLLEGLEQML